VPYFDKSYVFTETINQNLSILTSQQRVFETNLNNIVKEYALLVSDYTGEDYGGKAESGSFAYDDDGFLIEDQEEEDKPDAGMGEVVQDYCSLLKLTKEFKEEVDNNKDPKFKKYYTGSLNDITDCLKLNFLEKLHDKNLVKIKASCQ